MKIKEIKEDYKNYKLGVGEWNTFTTYDYNNGYGKVVIVVNNNKITGKTVVQVIRVSDGEKLLKGCRPCDSLDDAIDVAGEMEWNRI